MVDRPTLIGSRPLQVMDWWVCRILCFIFAAFALYLSQERKCLGENVALRNVRRAADLEQFVEYVSHKAIDRMMPKVFEHGQGVHASLESELHVRFLTGGADASADSQHGLVAFPAQVSGFKSQIDVLAGRRPVVLLNKDRPPGSDTVIVKMRINDLFGESDLSEKPIAFISIPTINHRSQFNTRSLIRDLLQLALEWYLPEVEIDGDKRWEDKQIVVRNNTEEKLFVWLRYLARERTASGFRRTILPSGTGYIRFVLQPHSDLRLKDIPANGGGLVQPGQSKPITASRILLWAKSETGDVWDKHRYAGLQLVAPNEKLGGDRCYHAEQISTYLYSIDPIPGPRIFTERLLSVRNSTREPLTVQVKFIEQDGVSSKWSYSEFPVAAGESKDVWNGEFRLRSPKVYVSARSSHQQFNKYEKSPLWLAGVGKSLRAYKADRIGTYQYTFETAPGSQEPWVGP